MACAVCLCVQARLTQDFSRCVGIELLSSLHGAAADVATRYDEQVKELLNSCQVRTTTLVLEEGDRRGATSSP